MCKIPLNFDIKTTKNYTIFRKFIKRELKNLILKVKIRLLKIKRFQLLKNIEQKNKFLIKTKTKKFNL